MKYGESAFEILYLMVAITTGIRILLIRKDAIGRIIGSAVLILGCGDAFHLVPRVLNYLINADFTAWLGFGKLVTSITMTAFYLLMYYLWLRIYSERENKKLTYAIYTLTLMRIVLCLMPQNRWLANESSVLWGVIRNIPFVALGCIIVFLYYQKRANIPLFQHIWLLVMLSFLFYIPVAAAAGLVPMLGMLMLPKTVCYILMIWIFWKYVAGERTTIISEGVLEKRIANK